MQEVVGSSPTVSTISAASYFSEVKKQRVLRLSSFFTSALTRRLHYIYRAFSEIT